MLTGPEEKREKERWHTGFGLGAALSANGGTAIIGEHDAELYKGRVQAYATPEEDAYIFRPNFYFDTNEKWRPLNIEDFLDEGDTEVCTEQKTGTCYLLTSPEGLNKARSAKALRLFNIKGDYKL